MCLDHGCKSLYEHVHNHQVCIIAGMAFDRDSNSVPEVRQDLELVSPVVDILVEWILYADSEEQKISSEVIISMGYKNIML